MPMTPCPACGAPLEYTGDGETIRCHFCGTEFQVTEEDARPRFEVRNQPEPQKEVLQKGVTRVDDSLTGDGEDALPSAPAQPVGRAGIYPSEPDIYQQAYQADLNMPEPARQQTVDTNRWSGVETPAQVPAPPLVGTPAGTSVMRGPGSVGRWIAIGVAVVLILCLACVCVAGLVFMAQNGNSFR